MFVVLDIGGTHMRLALLAEKPKGNGNIASQIVKLVVLATKNDYPKDLETIAKQFQLWQQEYHEAGKDLTLEAGAAGIAGAFSPDNKILLKAVHLNTWQDRELEDDFVKIFGCQFVFRNDTYMAVAGAIYLKNQTGDFWYVNWGSGIGGALAIDLHNVKVIDTWHYRIKPSEIGHASLNKNGILCACGQVGCWDAYCGGRELAKHFTKPLSELTLEEWRPIFADMAQGILNLYVSYPSDLIILNGGVIQHETDKLGLLQELLAKKLKIFSNPPTLIILGNGDIAGLVGSWLVAARILS